VKALDGHRSAREVGAGLPFVPQRMSVVTDVPGEAVRAALAHRESSRLLVCLRGSVRCLVDDGREREEFVLDSPELALHVPPMVWTVQHRFSAEATLLVLASHPHSAEDELHDHESFLSERRAFDAHRGSGAGSG
jgi:UDP-2-acetamido-3-amino-2,3-dideoxy-glucuronate N-acetyltransferase